MALVVNFARIGKFAYQGGVVKVLRRLKWQLMPLIRFRFVFRESSAAISMPMLGALAFASMIQYVTRTIGAIYAEIPQDM